MLQPNLSRLAVTPETEHFTKLAKEVSEQLKIPFIAHTNFFEIAEYPVVIWVGHQGIGIKQTGKGAPKPVFVDFVSGPLAHRNRHKANAKELIIKAVGIKPGQNINVLDATAGLGRDAFILAAFGCNVDMMERSPVVFMLLQNGMQRAIQQLEIESILARMKVYNLDALDYLKSSDKSLVSIPDVIYLDPMFPERTKSAKVKKEMSVLQLLLAEDSAETGLLDVARNVARKRVVVKRPRLAPSLDDRPPSFSITGKSSRFDVYQTFNED